MLVISIDTAGLRLYTCIIPNAPVLISADIASDAKYVDLNGFCVNHLYGTLTTDLFSSISLIITPEKNAAGNFQNKNILNFTGCLIIFINFSVEEFIKRM